MKKRFRKYLIQSGNIVLNKGVCSSMSLYFKVGVTIFLVRVEFGQATFLEFGQHK